MKDDDDTHAAWRAKETKGETKEGCWLHGMEPAEPKFVMRLPSPLTVSGGASSKDGPKSEGVSRMLERLNVNTYLPETECPSVGRCNRANENVESPPVFRRSLRHLAVEP